ncbi:SRPBCC family protein [Thiohalobacter sp. IOR34]|uniref:SRPBCC family protein n=1 Tax=Thiohalobacter sp. IOR34 TaxID=3057176 RepID=UPI0025B02DFC|nr:SRPBCC family protein [Thiohalobacter sp. IOR34]WJW75318.1 SRPBCC family protein [Thiohalobacter sp. IOR34]
MSRALLLLGLSSLLILGEAAQAAELLQVLVERRGERYRVEVDARFRASAAELRRLLTDYPRLGRLNDSIRESRVVEDNGPGSHCVYTLSRVCVAIFCRDIVQIQDIVQLENGDLMARVRPEGSDFRYGVARWHLWDEADGSRMRFTSEIEPAFWVPPLIGPWLVQRALRDEALKTVRNLERLAEGEAGAP